MKTITLCLMLLVAASALFVQPLVAGTTGKIAGLITDAKTGEPVVGANVMVVASWQNEIETPIRKSSIGASGDVSGRYFILNVPPGVYTVEASIIGWRKVRHQYVRVQVDYTTTVNFSLDPEAVEISTVVVEADRTQGVVKDQTSASAKINTEEIQALPVDNSNQLLSLQAGVTLDAGGGLHIRGGRSSEIQYYIDGIAVTNPFGGGLAVPVENNAIQELEVVSGTYNAEYGDALSGIVNIVTKEGGDRFSGSVQAYGGDFFTNKKVFLGLDHHSVKQKEVDMTFGGPVPGISTMSFFMSGRWVDEKNQYYGKRIYNIFDSSFISGADTSKWYREHTGDGALVPLAPSKSVSFNGKLTWKPSAMLKINYSFMGNVSQAKTFLSNVTMNLEKYNPDWAPTAYTTSYGHSVKLTQTMSASTFATLNLSYYYERYKRYVFEDPYDSQYAAIYGRGNQPTDVFATGGVNNEHLDQYSKTNAIRFDISSQANFIHLLKGGFELRFVDMAYDDYILQVNPNSFGNYIPVILPAGTSTHPYYERYPFQWAGYLQDKIEIKDFIVNIGLRYDYFDAQSVVPTSFLNPGNLTLPDRNPVPYDQAYKKVKAKTQLSPRLGFAFPITDRGVLHASYGQFFQIPPLPSLYYNPNFNIGPGQGSSWIGNADLNPQRTTMYELGLQQQLSENIIADVTAFHRDYRNLLGVQFYNYYEGGTIYGRYFNVDYGNSSGITIALDFHPSQDGFFSGSLNYTYLVAEGNGSDPLQALADLANGNEATKWLVPLNWDERHNLTATLTLSDHVWGISMIGSFRTGLPFTPNNLPELDNDDRLLSVYNINMQVFRNFNLGNIRLQIFARVENLFDTYSQDNIPRIDPQQVFGFNINHLNLLNSIEEFRNNPANYPMPRLVKLGMKIEY